MNRLRMSRMRAVLMGGGGVRYLFRDLFTTDRAAGAVHTTNAEPGPGTRVVVDTTNKLSLASGSLALTANSAWGNPGLWGSVQIPRLAGRVLAAIVASSPAGVSSRVGWWAAQNGAPGGPNLRFNVGTQLQKADGVAAPSVYIAAVTQGEPYRVCIILRDTKGAFFFAKGGTQFPVWRLLHVSAGDAEAAYYPGFTTYNGNGLCDQLEVPNSLYIPVPVASDSFNRADGAIGSTDGAATAEVGGSGKAWTNQVGSFAIGTNKAVPTLDGGLAVATVDAGSPDLYVQATPTLAGGSVGLVAWWTDADNHLRVRHDGTNAVLEKVVAGFASTLKTAAKALADVAIVTRGTTVTLFANDSGVDGNETAVADVTPTNLCGLYSTDAGNTIDNFVAWKTGGHEILDNFFSSDGPAPAFFATGDSKSVAFSQTLTASLTSGTGDYWYHYEGSYPGYSVALYLTNIETILANIPANVGHILLQIGTNDLALGLPAEATWKANYRAIIERLHAQCPNAQIGLARPVYLQAIPPSTPVAETATLKQWIEDVEAEYAYCFLGPDETALEGGDGYVTNFVDRAHCTAAGYTATAAAWQTAMGYV